MNLPPPLLRHREPRISAAWRSILFFYRNKDGSPRRYAPRNDGVIHLIASFVMPAKAGIHDFVSKRKRISIFVSNAAYDLDSN